MRSPFKTHGGKSYLVDTLLPLMPKHDLYIEPFGGGASLLLNKQVTTEVYNDIDPMKVAVWQMLKKNPREFRFKMMSTRYCENSFNEANPKDPFEYFIRNRMSRGGLEKDFAWSDRERGGEPGDVHAWETMIEEIMSIHLRIKNVYFFNMNAIDLLKFWNSSSVFFYLDPPYVHGTRVTPEAYDFEMSDSQHTELLAVISQSKAKIMISGYLNPLYEYFLRGWKIFSIRVKNRSGQGKTLQDRIEVVWRNY